MVVVAKRTGRVGRPPGGDGDETRQRILSAARSCFAEHGYAATTNRMIADRAGLTSAAVYHHFGRKQDLMLAVYDWIEERYLDSIQAALREADGFVGKVSAFLDVIHRTVREDPEQVLFFSVARDDARRTPELARIAEDRAFFRIFGQLAEEAVRSGVVTPAEKTAARGAIAAVAMGLAMMVTEVTTDAHRVATEGAKQMLLGELFRSSRGTGRNGRRRPT